MNYGSIPTDIGLAKLRNASVLGSRVDIVRVVFGDSGGVEYEPLGSETALKNQVYETAPLSIQEAGENKTWIEIEAVIPHNVGGWYVREFGCYDSDGDLIFIGNLPPSSKPSGAAGIIKDMAFELVYDASSADVVGISVDPAFTIATRKYVDQKAQEHLDEEDPHNQYKEYADQKDTAHAEASDPHPQYQTKEQAATAGGETSEQINLLGTGLSTATTMINTLSLQLSTSFAKLVVSEPAFQLDGGTLKTVADLGVAIDGNFYSYNEGTGLVMPASMSLGTDYAIYATPDGLVVSDNFTVPAGYTALTSRRVGGFHYQNGEINEFSLYDVKYCPNARNALTKTNDSRGMVRSPLGIWGDIYLLNVSPDINGTSAYNVTIADGSSPPKVPVIWGGDGTAQYDDFSQYTAARMLAAYGKRLPSSHEFEQLAFGCVAGYAVGTDPVTTKFDDSAKSMIGCEQVSGHMWQWGSERWDRGNGSSGYAWYAGDTNGEGQIYTAGSAGVGASLFGGDWTDSGEAGSRASDWSNEPWDSSGDIGARGVCDHFESL